MVLTSIRHPVHIDTGFDVYTMYTEGMCRVCLRSCIDAKPLFATLFPPKLMKTSCAEAIAQLTNLNMCPVDGTPSCICGGCLVKLKSAYKFKILCEESHFKLDAYTKRLQEEAQNGDPAERIDISNIAIDNRKNAQPIIDTPIAEIKSYDRRLQCEKCAKVFTRKGSLETHILSHENGPFRCTHPDCGKSFALKSRLRLHMRVHTDERNFICHYCSHAARDKQQLTVHIRYFHTKEKKFACKQCGKTFVSPQARYYHTKRHENVRKHRCQQCDKSFVFAFSLREHLVTHTGVKRFACDLCESRFSRKAHKERHEIRLHGVSRKQ